jgi:hypothetical protein
MNLILKRETAGIAGIFGVLEDESGKALFMTLEHAFRALDRDGYEAKLPAGEYLCKKGLHRLASMADPFETFEVKNVPGHWGILFHAGNFNRDSNGCILIGSGANQAMITGSRTAFAQFMELQKEVSEFNLTVKDSR